MDPMTALRHYSLWALGVGALLLLVGFVLT
jgi:hypothetical protein